MQPLSGMSIGPIRAACALVVIIFFTACGGGSGSSSSPLPQSGPVGPGSGDGDNVQDNIEPPRTAPVAAFSSETSTGRFLTQSTFGPTLPDIRRLTGTDASDWFLQQIAEPAGYLLPVIEEFSALPNDDEERLFVAIEATTFGFWRNAIAGRDQLRQRMAFALSEILVVSNGGGELLTDVPEAVAYFQDLLIRHALGNYRDLLEEVTYSPAMGYYLTYLGSEKGDPVTGRMPDENYARELMQLFTIGVLELNTDGTARLDSEGKTIETYGNRDVTGLARVFTGLNIAPRFLYDEEGETESETIGYANPMAVYAESHSSMTKTFLGTSIPAGTSGEDSITLALDHIFAHPNVAPFISRQLIQRLVTSNPTPDYTARVAAAFDAGRFALPSGQLVGEGRRGDLAATAAAILFDAEARALADEQGGKIREPILRFTHWARAFDIAQVTPVYTERLWETSSPLDLGQHPYRAPSVFNFFRPGYVAQGSLTGERGLNAPELQITNASTLPGYSNFIADFVFLESEAIDVEELQEIYDEEGIPLDARQAANSFVPDYARERALASDPDALLDHLDRLLTYGTLGAETRLAIREVIQEFPLEEEWALDERVRFAIFMIMTSPDYLVQL